MFHIYISLMNEKSAKMVIKISFNYLKKIYFQSLRQFDLTVFFLSFSPTFVWKDIINKIFYIKKVIFSVWYIFENILGHQITNF